MLYLASILALYLIVAVSARPAINMVITKAPRLNNMTDAEFMKKLALQRENIFTIRPQGEVFAVPNEPLRNALPEGSAAYYGAATIGTPAQTLYFIMDTGSSNFWASSAQSVSAWGFDFTKSSTYTTSSTPISIQYGSGSVSGHLATDQAGIAGINAGTVTFGVMTQEQLNSPFPKPIAGLIGLAYKAIATDSVTPLLDTLYTRGYIPTNSFAMYLNPKVQATTQGVMTIGGTDSSLYSGEFTYTPIVHEEWYVINIDGISSQGTQYTSRVGVIVDSGTSCITGPSTVVSQLLANIRVASDCSNLDSLPEIDIMIAGRNFTITGNDYVLQVDGQCQICISGMNLPTSLPFQWILGDSFMHGYYTHFDKTNSRIGFATAI